MDLQADLIVSQDIDRLIDFCLDSSEALMPRRVNASRDRQTSQVLRNTKLILNKIPNEFCIKYQNIFEHDTSTEFTNMNFSGNPESDPKK